MVFLQRWLVSALADYTNWPYCHLFLVLEARNLIQDSTMERNITVLWLKRLFFFAGLLPKERCKQSCQKFSSLSPVFFSVHYFFYYNNTLIINTSLPIEFLISIFLCFWIVVVVVMSVALLCLFVTPRVHGGPPDSSIHGVLQARILE